MGRVKPICYVLILCCLSLLKLSAQDNAFLPAKIDLNGAFPRIWHGEQSYPALAYMSYLGKEKNYQPISKTGVHIYNIPAYLGDRGINSASGIKPFRQAIWQGKGQFDYSSVEEDFRKIISSDNDAKAIIRLHLDPPIWWDKQNLDHTSLQPDGSSFRFSLFSKKWRNEAGEALRLFIKWLEQSAYANRVIGIHLAAGGTEEWFYHYKDHFYDLSNVRLQGFREWLSLKYKTNDQLKKAWNDPQVTFKTASTANISGENREDRWLDLSKEGQIFDTFCFQSENLSSHIQYFCDLVKKESNGDLLTGVFYGYHNFVTDPRRGHGSLYDVLKISSLDYISSPNDYNRVQGEDWPPMVAMESVKLHGKLWMAENDTRTHLTTLLKDEAPEVDPGPPYYRDGVWLGPKSEKLSSSFLWKNLGRMLAYNYGGWWFDMWGGWFNSPELLQVIATGQKLTNNKEQFISHPLNSEIAVIVDEKLQFRDASYGKLTNEFYQNRYTLGKIGTPYSQYLREDMFSLPKGRFKMVWLLGCFDLSQHEQDLIDSLLRQNVAVLITDKRGSVLQQKGTSDKLYPNKIKWSAQEICNLYQQFSIHKYADAGDVLYVGNDWLSIHANQKGTKTLYLPFSAELFDVMDNKRYKLKDTTFRLDMNSGDTRLFKIISK